MPSPDTEVKSEEDCHTLSPEAIARRAHELLAETPSIAAAYFENDEYDEAKPSINLTFLTKDFRDEAEQVSYVSRAVDIEDLTCDEYLRPGLLLGPSTIVAQKQDGHDDHRIVLREVPDTRKKGGKRRLIDIYDALQRVTSLDVTDQHGPFITEASHASLDILASRKIAVYSAEKLEPGAADLTKRFEYTPSLGEKTHKNQRPGIFIIEWATATSCSEPARKSRRLSESSSTLIEGTLAASEDTSSSSESTSALNKTRSARCISDVRSVKCRLAGPLVIKGDASNPLKDLIFGQAVLMPGLGINSAIKVIATGYPLLGNKARLGNIYCNNRPSDIYSVSFERAPIHHDPKQLANWTSSASPSGNKPDRWEVSAREVELLTTRATTSQTSRPLPSKISWRKPFACFGLREDVECEASAWQERLFMLGTATGGPHNSCSFLRVQILRRKLDGNRLPIDTVTDKFDCTIDFDRTFFAGRDIHRPYQHVEEQQYLEPPSLSNRDVFLLNALSLGASKIDATSSSFLSVQANLTDDELSLSVTNLQRASRRPVSSSDSDSCKRASPSGCHEEILCTWDNFGVVAILRSSLKHACTWLSICKIDFLTNAGPSIIPEDSLDLFVPRAIDSFDRVGSLRKGLKGGDFLTKLAECNSGREGAFKRFPGTKYVRPKRRNPSDRPPTIIIPHGGPHGFSSAAFNASHIALATMGYQLYLPNYPGSIGKDEAYVHELIGHCGEKDVQYCMDFVNTLCEHGFADPDQIYVMGGSHGGFIAAHLISQFPGAFRAAVMRNPVVDLATNVVQTDIPDWCYAELGLPYDFSHPPSFPSESDFVAMRRASPIQHVERVQARVLLLVGLADRRVPPQQSREYYHALKGAGKEVDMLCFEDADHALETIEAQKYGFERMFAHFEKTAGEERKKYSLFGV